MQYYTVLYSIKQYYTAAGSQLLTPGCITYQKNKLSFHQILN